MPRFSDCPLGEERFRLFRLKQSTSAVEIEVKTFKIYKAPKYEAISYVWGEKSDGTAIIVCNGEPMEVWINLHSALLRLQCESSTSWFWNDALCIEQGDEEVALTEKARQIAFMETIFTLGQPVRAWLGDASEDEERTFQYLVERCQKLAEQGVALDDISGLPSPRDDIWHLWAQIIVRPWFSRLWIVQEALLSGDLLVTLGKQTSTSWNSFWQMIERTAAIPATDDWRVEYDKLDSRARLTVDREFLSEWNMPLAEYKHGPDNATRHCIYRNVINIRELIYLARQNYSLQQTLKVYGNRRCTYNQDRPNAMRGVLPKHVKKGMKVYDTGADVATVYREVTRLWLTKDPTLSLLQRVRPIEKFLPEGDKTSGSKLNNPSWVLDLGRVLTESMASDAFNELDGFHAGLIRQKSWSGKTEWKVPELGFKSRLTGPKHVDFPTDGQLQVSGAFIGLVHSVATNLSRRALVDLRLRSATSHHCSDWKHWLVETCQLIQKAVPEGEDVTDIHWRLLVHNRADTSHHEVKTMYDIDNKFSRLDAYNKMLDIIQSRELEKLQNAENIITDYYTTLFLLQRDFPNVFALSSNLVGKSYPRPQPGDVVAVFNGAATPFLLRPVPGQNTYEFMGEAYVHGVMQGEALLAKNKDKYPRQKFVLV